MEKLFKIKERGSNVRTEIMAGVTTFLTMAYIIFVNPSILSATGMDFGAVMLATCISAAIGTLIMGLYANIPFAQAPGMGLNAFFTFTIVFGLGYSWQAALAAVFISGILFIILTVTKLREAIVKAIPAFLKKAISGGIGLFIAYVGIKNAGLLSFTLDPGTWSESNDTIFGNASAIPSFGIASASSMLAVIGLVVTIVLVAKGIKGGLLISIAVTTAIGALMQYVFGWDVGIITPDFSNFAFPSLAPTFGQFVNGFTGEGGLFDLSSGIGVGILSIVTVLISLTLVDMFDTIGTLIGTASRAGMLDEDGELPDVGKALLADAVATAAGAVLGTSTVTTYVESSTGISEGGKTGLTSVTTALLFIGAIVFTPVLGIVPGAATAPVLIVVGVLMMASLKDLDWTDFDIAAPAFLTVAMMPFAYSISEGIGIGFISYVLIKLVKGKFRDVHPIMFVVALLFLARYVILNLP
ncbi:MAG: NCS2 family permease [Oscillospiraceae bacterium]|jgi:AGZA family xanthine/uracil permease-like MFS transporter|nr:NCS2 family permease [Oscillospiraceae bacterium]